MSAPPGGFYAAQIFNRDPVTVKGNPFPQVEVPLFLAGPFRQWADANEACVKVLEWLNRNEFVVDDKHYVTVVFYQAPNLPKGGLNGKLWVDGSKLVS